jgi:hypothetical protein
MANHLSFNIFIQLVEGRASPVEEAKAKRHLASCGRCRSELEWLQRIERLPSHPSGLEVGWGGLGGAYR